MDWRSINFDWNQARAFLVTAEEGTLSAAARALGMTQPTLGRQVAALENKLGLILFDRLPRGLVLTPSGLELVEHVRAMGEAANHISLTASGQSQSIEGTISISASELDAIYMLPPIIAKLRKSHPKISIDIIASNEISDLRRREADIAIRNTRPTQPDLIAKKIKDETAWLYATPGYLKKIDNPSTMEDLQRADFIGFDNNDVLIKGLVAYGLHLTSQNFPIVSNNQTVHWELIKTGIAIGIFPTPIADKERKLTRVLPNYGPITYPVWLVAHREVQTSRRVRTVFDLLAKELAAP